MANVNQPSGLSPVGHLLGLNWNQRAARYYIASNNGSAFAIGDPVALSGTSDANGVPGIVLATAGTGNTILGVIVSMGGPNYGGVSADPNNLNTTVIPATKTKAYYVDVVTDPYVLFEVQDDGSATLASTDVSNNFNLVAGTNNGYVSGWQLAANSAGTGATLQVQLLQLAQKPNNVVGINAKWIVRIVNHQYLGGTAGVA